MGKKKPKSIEVWPAVKPFVNGGASLATYVIQPIDMIKLVEVAKAQFSRDYSDHLALVRAYEAWKEAERDVARYEYCRKNFVSAQSMKAIDAL